VTDSNKQSVYRKTLLDHFHNPRNRAELTIMDTVSSSRNPMCGDEVDVGLLFLENGQADIRFRGRGCSVCIASASIMAENCSGMDLPAVQAEHRRITDWLIGQTDIAPDSASVLALDAVRLLPARKRCVMLAWEALEESLQKLVSKSNNGVSG